MNVKEAIERRYSVRKYSDRPVEEEKLANLLESARICPSAKNYQPIRIYVIKSRENREKLAKITPCTFGAPIILAFCYNTDEMWKSTFGDGRTAGETDAAIVATSVMYRATELGLGTCWVGYFNKNEFAETFGLPKNVVTAALMPVGYAADDAVPSERHALRKNLSDIITEL